MTPNTAARSPTPRGISVLNRMAPPVGALVASVAEALESVALAEALPVDSVEEADEEAGLDIEFVLELVDSDEADAEAEVELADSVLADEEADPEAEALLALALTDALVIDATVFLESMTN